MIYLFKNQKGTKFISDNVIMYFVDITDIISIEYEDNQAKINIKNREAIYDTRTLEEIKEELYEFGFFQIDKNTLVNFMHITEIDKPKKGKYSIKFAGIKKDISVEHQKEFGSGSKREIKRIY